MQSQKSLSTANFNDPLPIPVSVKPRPQSFLDPDHSRQNGQNLEVLADGTQNSAKLFKQIQDRRFIHKKKKTRPTGTISSTEIAI